MFGLQDLKEDIEFDEQTVKCPVINCDTIVERQRHYFIRDDKFKCQKHKIFISPTAFEYENELDNLLWKEKEDLDLLEQIKTVKRESRIAKNDSEDAVTWNIFRYLEKNKLIQDFLLNVFQSKFVNPEIIYWSYSSLENGMWSYLYNAREEFEAVPSKGSEPDLIIFCENAILVIEAKLNASNKTTPSHNNIQKYKNGGNKWWNEVFNSNFQDVAISQQKYELARFWLLGTWMAEKIGVNFYLINLVLEENEKDIESIFKKYIVENDSRRFIRHSWENVYEYINENNDASRNKEMILDYFENKTSGYDHKKRLKRAFTILLNKV